MPSTHLPFRAARVFAAALALTAVAACNDSNAPEDDPADQVATIRLVVTPQVGAAQTFNVTTTGAVTPSPLRVPTGASTVAATFLRADGSVVSADDLAEFQLRFEPGAGLTFTRTAPFTGTLNATAAAGTAVPVTMCLFHIAENHCDIGSWQGFGVTIGF